MESIKCLIWDLDNTLWDGTLLEGGVKGLRAGIPSILGELDRRGILQSIASTNDHESAWNELKRLGVQHYFVWPQINFGPKAESIQGIAERCGFALRHLAFIDDDPYERARVQVVLPSVLVLSAEQYARVPLMAAFSPAVVSRETWRRRETLLDEMRREEVAKEFMSFEEFLEASGIEFMVGSASEADLDRLSELSLRTNRMNTSGMRFTSEQLRQWMKRPDHVLVLGAMRDRFGDYGTVAAAAGRTVDASLLVEALWMSCRVAKRDVPAAFLSFLSQYSLQMGRTRLQIRYVPSPDNRLAAVHLGTCGFRLGQRGNGNDEWFTLSLPNGLRPYPKWMRVTVRA